MKRKIFWNTFTATDSLLEGEEDPLFPTSTKTGEKMARKLMGSGQELQEYTFYKGLTSDIEVSLEDSHMKRY